MLDFAQLPPEINSALMYSGPGSGYDCWPPRRPGFGAGHRAAHHGVILRSTDHRPDR